MQWDRSLEEMSAVRERIVQEVLAWPGVSQAPHRFGGVEFRFHGSELGHLHGERLADLPFPKKVRDDLIAAGRVKPHHVVPESGWVSRWIGGPEDADEVVALFRMQYERLAARHEQAEKRRAQRSDGIGGQA